MSAPTPTRKWAEDGDCADCGATDAAYRFQGCRSGCCDPGEGICKDCAPQYDEFDLVPAG